jgi:hypothetical protein
VRAALKVSDDAPQAAEALIETEKLEKREGYAS